MGRKRRVEGTQGAKNSMIAYVPPVLMSAFDSMCKKRGFSSRSERIRFLMQRDLEEYTGQATPLDFDYEGKETELLKLWKDEDSLAKDLQKDILANRRSAYEELCAFAESFGSDKTLTKNHDQVLRQLHLYLYTGKEAFSERQLELFIQMFEIAIKRRALKVELDQHRKNGLGLTVKSELVATEI